MTALYFDHEAKAPACLVCSLCAKWPTLDRQGDCSGKCSYEPAHDLDLNRGHECDCLAPVASGECMQCQGGQWWHDDEGEWREGAPPCPQCRGTGATWLTPYHIERCRECAPGDVEYEAVP